MLKFCVKVFKISSFLNPCTDLLIFGMIIDFGPKLYFPTPAYDLEVKVMDREIYVKVKRVLHF